MTKKIIIACTGSVATIKLLEIVEKFLHCIEPKFEIKIIVTERAKHFLENIELPEQILPILTDQDEWTMWQGRGDPVLHIDLSKWADLIILAPLDANTLAKIANGICDNLLLCTVRAWTKPIFFCPAMNTNMWNHPITKPQIDTLKSWGYHEIPCISKTLMCGDIGLGAMATPETIFNVVFEFFNKEIYNE